MRHEIAATRHRGMRKAFSGDPACSAACRSGHPVIGRSQALSRPRTQRALPERVGERVALRRRRTRSRGEEADVPAPRRRLRQCGGRSHGDRHSGREAPQDVAPRHRRAGDSGRRRGFRSARVDRDATHAGTMAPGGTPLRTGEDPGPWAPQSPGVQRGGLRGPHAPVMQEPRCADSGHRAYNSGHVRTGLG
jgi:hypothetical protein